MLPRLQAEEQLRAIDVTLLASGGFSQWDAAQMMAGLRQSARGEIAQPKRKASPEQLRSIGIGVTIVPPPSQAGSEVPHG